MNKNSRDVVNTVEVSNARGVNATGFLNTAIGILLFSAAI